MLSTQAAGMVRSAVCCGIGRSRFPNSELRFSSSPVAGSKTAMSVLSFSIVSPDPSSRDVAVSIQPMCSGLMAVRSSESSTRDGSGRGRRSVCPHLRVHDLKHTFGRRLRAAGVSFEDRQDLLGHRSGRITTHYSSAELSRLVDAANSVVEREWPQTGIGGDEWVASARLPQNSRKRDERSSGRK